jgi:hypothetical protein
MCKLITMTQGMIKVQAVQFWYGILNKELRCQNVGCHVNSTCTTHFGQCVQLLEHVEMNMVGKKMVTFRFNKENLINASTPSIQQPCG